RFANPTLPCQPAAIADLAQRDKLTPRDMHRAGNTQQPCSCDRDHATRAGPDRLHEIEARLTVRGTYGANRPDAGAPRTDIMNRPSCKRPLGLLGFLEQRVDMQLVLPCEPRNQRQQRRDNTVLTGPVHPAWYHQGNAHLSSSATVMSR